MARGLGMPRVVAEALEQQAHLAADGDPDRAVDLHHQALAERVEHGLRTFYVDSLDALATLDAGAQPTSEAVRVLAASDQAREAMAYPRDPQPGGWPTTPASSASGPRWGRGPSPRRGPRAPA
jgi:hypothetical protein